MGGENIAVAAACKPCEGAHIVDAVPIGACGCENSCAAAEYIGCAGSVAALVVCACIAL